MARRSDHTREELHDLALQAAGDIVAESGADGLTARAIAKRIGYAPGTLYNVFEDLDDLILQLNGRTLDSLAAQMASVELSGEPETDLRRVLDAYLAFVAAHPDAWALVFDHRWPDGRALPEWYEEKADKPFDTVERALAPLYPPGADAELHQVARLLWASVHGFCALAGSGKLGFVGQQSVGDLAFTLVRRFVTGLKSELAAT